MVPLRLALSLPGGIAPGTFEAGAVCGLLSWIQELNALQANTVVLDVIAGASAGALTGLLSARVLIAGDDPVAVLRRAWVVAPSLRALRGRGILGAAIAPSGAGGRTKPGFRSESARLASATSLPRALLFGCLRQLHARDSSPHAHEDPRGKACRTRITWIKVYLRTARGP